MGGVVTLFCHDTIVHHVPFGWADYARQIPVSDSTMFRIASVSKVVTAMGFMRLADQGMVNLDDDISAILGYQVRNPYFTNQPITPRMLLSHTSSIIDGNTYSSFLNATINQNPIPNLSEILTPGGAFYSSSNFNNVQPGTYFNYSNLNYAIIGTLIEKISGRRFDEFMRDSVLLPLGIKGSYNVNHISNVDLVAVLYRKINGTWTAQADNYQGNQPVPGNLTGYIPGTNGARFSPHGGLRCSGRDLSRIFQLLLNKGTTGTTVLLSLTAVQKMLADAWTYNGSNGNNYYDLFNSFGLGLHRALGIPGKDVVLAPHSVMFGHPGEAYGLVSDAYVDTTRRLGFVFITNGCGTGYQVSSASAYYTVEKAVFDDIAPYADAMDCLKLTHNADSERNSISIFPNPAEEFILLSLKKSGEKISQYEIFNIHCQLVASGFIHQPHQAIFLTHLPSGVYTLRIQEGAFTLNKRLIKK